MIRIIGRTLLYLVLLLCLIVAGLLLTARFAPSSLVGLLNNALERSTGYQLQLEDVAVQYAPLTLTLTDVQVRDGQVGDPDQPLLDLAQGKVTVEVWDALTGSGPFWSVSANQADIYIVASEPAQAPGQPTSATASAPINVERFLSFLELDIKRINLHLIDQQGQTDLLINTYVSQKSANTISLNADLQQPDGLLQFEGQINFTKNGEHELLEVSAAHLDLSSLMPRAAEASADPAEASPESTHADATVELPADIPESTAIEAAIDWSWLDLLSQLTVRLAIDEIIAAAHSVTEMQTEVDFRDGVIALKSLSGTYQGESAAEPITLPFTAQLRVDPLSRRSEGADVSLTAKANIAGVQTEMSGQINVNGFSGNDVTLKLNAKEVGDLRKLAPINVAPFLPLAADLEFATQTDADTNQHIKLDKLALNYAESDITGSAQAQFGSKLAIQGNFESNNLHIPDLAKDTPEPDEEKPADATPPPEDLLSKQPIDWSWLSNADIDIKFTAQQLQLLDAQFSDFQAVAVGNDGTLKLEPFQAKFGGGGFSVVGEMAQQTATEAPGQTDGITAAFKVAVNEIQLDAFGLFSAEDLQGGVILADIDLTAAGASPHQLGASLDGEILVTVTEAIVQNDTFELVGSDLLMETLSKLNPFTKSDPTTELECALVRFEATDGVLKSKNQLVVETTKMEIIGNGDVDLNDETLNIGISPSTKGGVGLNVGSVVKFMKLGGKLNNPKPAVDAAGLVKSGAAIGAALSTGGLSILAEGIVKQAVNAGNACDRALAPPTPAAPDTVREAPISEPNAKPPVD